MNKLIKQLAEQAFDNVNNGTITDTKIPNEFVERFAELIIKNCLSLMVAERLEHIKETKEYDLLIGEPSKFEYGEEDIHVTREVTWGRIWTLHGIEFLIADIFEIDIWGLDPNLDAATAAAEFERRWEEERVKEKVKRKVKR
jgi:hypothetical protein